jgi:hypothetical protein
MWCKAGAEGSCDVESGVLCGDEICEVGGAGKIQIEWGRAIGLDKTRIWVTNNEESAKGNQGVVFLSTLTWIFVKKKMDRTWTEGASQYFDLRNVPHVIIF